VRVCVCVRACVRVCVCVRACVRVCACVRVFVRAVCASQKWDVWEVGLNCQHATFACLNCMFMITSGHNRGAAAEGDAIRKLQLKWIPLGSSS